MAKEWKRLKSVSKKKDKNTDIEIDTSNYEVVDSDKNLEEANNKYPKIDWFACYTIKDKKGNQVNKVSGGYTIKFDGTATGKYYYYYNNTANPLDVSDVKTGRVKATLDIGDPPIGMD